MKAPTSQHLAPQKVEFVKETRIEGVLHKVTLTATWGLNCRRHQLTIAVTMAPATGFGLWGPESHMGASYDLVKQYWPQFAGAVAYHGCSLSGPLNYIKNTVFLAGVCDCYGWEKGQQRIDGHNDQPLWVVDVPGLFHVIDSPEQPAPLILHYEPWLVETEMSWGPNRGIPLGEKQRDENGDHIWRIPERAFPLVRSVAPPAPLVFEYAPYQGEGKERDLEGARRAAIWPEATEAELCVGEYALTTALNYRLPTVLTQLKAVVESLGMVF